MVTRDRENRPKTKDEPPNSPRLWNGGHELEENVLNKCSKLLQQIIGLEHKVCISLDF